MSKEHPGEAPSRAVQTRRMGRFIYAFSKIFGNLNYDHTEVRDGRQEVLFKKEGKLVSLDNLSSGEKQIVFRGGFFLSNQQTTIGTPVLIDEPEISLHPLWQKKAFDFYRKLSVASNGQQTSQVFFATHSEYILDTAFSDDEKTIIIVCQDGRCNLIDKKLYSAVFPVTTAAELRYRIFNIISIDFHIQLYAYIQKLSNTSRSILKCDQFIEKSSSHNKAEHEKISSYNNTKYHTISTYIRNAIDHPGEGKEYSEEELDASVKLMISIIRNENSKKA